MKRLQRAFQIARATAAIMLFGVAALNIGSAQPGQSGVAKGNALGLPRLKPTDAAPLTVGQFDDDSIDSIAALGGRKQSQLGIDFVALDAGGVWSAKLRGLPRDVVFVAFCANASVGTEFDLAGAVLRVEAGTDPNKADLVVIGAGSGDKPRVVHCAVDNYDGLALAALPVLTVRLDPASGEWDLFLGTHLYVGGVPLVDESRKAARNMTILAGVQGAHLCGLVVSDENPLFVDANGNGIADDFETSRLGTLLSEDTPAADRKAVVNAWRKAQGPGHGFTLWGKRPATDKALALLPPKR